MEPPPCRKTKPNVKWPSGTRNRTSISVFPACAGMFLTRCYIVCTRSSFPRVRGDVPLWLGCTQSLPTFSPRARGCSSFEKCVTPSNKVFPACAGMFLRVIHRILHPIRFPRVRGDVPGVWVGAKHRKQFSPRARGCSGRVQALVVTNDVFPACAGMFLCSSHHLSVSVRFPRVRGDVPIIITQPMSVRRFSPRARGCSCPNDETDPPPDVFPACAGMFLAMVYANFRLIRFPRVRGDVPT